MIHRVTCEKRRRKIATAAAANFDLINRATNAALVRPSHETYFDAVNFTRARASAIITYLLRRSIVKNRFRSPPRESRRANVRDAAGKLLFVPKSCCALNAL